MKSDGLAQSYRCWQPYVFKWNLCVKLGTAAEQYGTSDFMLLMRADPWHSVW